MIQEKLICAACGRATDSNGRCPICTTEKGHLTDVAQRLSEAVVVTKGGDETVPCRTNAVLIVRNSERRYELRRTRVTIGRDTSNTIVTAGDTSTSRLHALIAYEEGEFWLQDLGSTNGTLLNGRPVFKRQVLTSGDNICVGHTELIFKVEQ